MSDVLQCLVWVLLDFKFVTNQKPGTRFYSFVALRLCVALLVTRVQLVDAGREAGRVRASGGLLAVNCLLPS